MEPEYSNKKQAQQAGDRGERSIRNQMLQLLMQAIQVQVQGNNQIQQKRGRMISIRR